MNETINGGLWMKSRTERSLCIVFIGDFGFEIDLGKFEWKRGKNRWWITGKNTNNTFNVHNGRDGKLGTSVRQKRSGENNRNEDSAVSEHASCVCQIVRNWDFTIDLALVPHACVYTSVWLAYVHIRVLPHNVNAGTKKRWNPRRRYLRVKRTNTPSSVIEGPLIGFWRENSRVLLPRRVYLTTVNGRLCETFTAKHGSWQSDCGCRRRDTRANIVRALMHRRGRDSPCGRSNVV